MKIFEIANFAHGYDDSLNEELTPPTATQNCKNVDYTQEVGAVKKDYGFKVVTSTSITTPLAGALQAIYEGSMWASGTGQFINKRIVVAGGTAYQYCAGNFFLALGDGGEFNTTAEDYVDIVHYVTDFIMADGSSSHNIKKWNGFNTDIDNLVGATGVYRGKRLAVFENRLLIGNVYDVGTTTWQGNRVRWSNLGDPETWTASDYADIVDKEGDEIVRLKPLTDNLVIFKQNSIHSMTFTGGDIPFTIRPIDKKSVNNAPWSVAKGKEGLFFLNQEGINFTDGMRVDLLPADMKVTNILKRLYVNNIHKAYATSLDTLHQYWLAIPIDGSETCNYIIIYDWKHDTWKVMEKDINVLGVFSNEFAGTWSPFASYYGYELAAISWDSSLLYGGSKELFYGLSDGTVDKRSISYNDNGSGYDAYHETPWLDFGNPGEYKELLKIQPVWKGIVGDYVDIQYKKDYEAAWTSCTVDAFDESGVIEQPFIFLRDNGKKWKFRISNNNADEYFALYKMLFYYNERGER